MSRGVGRLTSLSVARAKQRGYLADGGGLYLQISGSGAKSWVFRFRVDGRLREMGLGSVQTFGLAEARQLAAECRKQRALGFDPIDARNSAAAKAKVEAARAMTFRQCAEAYLASHRASWKNAKHASQWEATLRTYAYTVIGELPAQAVDVSAIRKILDPIWTSKTETASRLRGRVEAILDWATVAGYRTGDNPARWRGHLDKMLPARSTVKKTSHHSALPYQKIGRFMADLRQQNSHAAAALELAILTATRTGEVIGASWDELDLDKGIWTIPAHRMKAKREHRVPLSKPALALLKRVRKRGSEPYVCPGLRPDQPLSNMAMLQLLRRMGRPDITVHGFRSTFRDWAAEQTSFPREVCEQALAHSLPDRVEAAYLRSDLFDKRRKLMDTWANYCSTELSRIGR